MSEETTSTQPSSTTSDSSSSPSTETSYTPTSGSVSLPVENDGSSVPEAEDSGESLSMDQFMDIHPTDPEEVTEKESKGKKDSTTEEITESPGEKVEEGEVPAPQSEVPAKGSREEVLTSLVAPGEEVFFKKLPNAAFNYFTSKLNDLKEFQESVPKVEAYINQLKSQAIPQNWAEHPEAYTLHKDYKEASAIVAQGEKELAFWEEQLIKVKEGQPWSDVEKNAKGEFVLVEKEPSTKAELQLQKHISTVQDAMKNAAAKRDSVKSSFEGMHTKVVNSVEKILADNFKDIVDNPSHVAWPHIKQVNGVLESFGQAQNPLAPLVSALYGRLAEYNAFMKGQLKQTKVAATKAKDTKAIGPTSSNKSSGVSGDSSGLLSMEDFDLSSRME